jgi:hypothetical protein
MDNDPKIYTFQQRRAVELALDALGETTNEADLVEAVRALKFAHPTALLLPALLKRLNTPSSQLRGGLARLAALLPSEETALALRRYVADRRNPPTGRTTAAMIMDRFLGDPAPPALTADLRESDDAAFQSLAEAVTDAQTNPQVLLEYVTQMQPYGEEIALLVLHHLDRLPADERVPLLRLMAQDERPVVARAALGRLDALASENSAAARAIYTLQWATAPAIAALAERAHRKLQFRGGGFRPAEALEARALLAPAEISGAQWLLFVLPAHGQTPASRPLLAGFHLHLDYGILDSFYGEAGALLPPPGPLGSPVALPSEAGDRLYLEVGFDLGRFLLRRGLAPHAGETAKVPLRADYRLHHDRIWQYAPPAPQPEAAALLGSDELAPLPDGDVPAVAAALEAEPCMAEWLIPARPLHKQIAQMATGPAEVLLTRMAREALEMIDSGPAGSTVRRNLDNGLRLQAVWLQAAGRAPLAQEVVRLARTLAGWPLVDNPLLFVALRRGLEVQRMRWGL